jgi:hypothetical protein
MPLTHYGGRRPIVPAARWGFGAGRQRRFWQVAADPEERWDLVYDVDADGETIVIDPPEYVGIRRLINLNNSDGGALTITFTDTCCWDVDTDNDEDTIIIGSTHGYIQLISVMREDTMMWALHDGFNWSTPP